MKKVSSSWVAAALSASLILLVCPLLAATPGLQDLFSTKSYPLPSPTILFIKPTHLTALTSSITSESEKSFAFPMAWRQKMAGIMDGYITKEGLWDRLVFEGARTKVIGEGAGNLRGVVVAGDPGLDSDALTPARITLSVPFVNARIHPVSTAPIFASHPLDLQTFAPSSIAHVGPPVINVEVKLKEVNDGEVESGKDPVGKLFVRGPIVGKLLAQGEDVEGKSEESEEVWVPTGLIARAQTNGSFKVWAPTK